MKAYYLIFICLISLSCRQADQPDGLNEQIAMIHENGYFNGAVIVTERNSVILSRGFGYADFENNIPFDVNTPMDTGSITKTFTALAMIVLTDSNQIDLNTAVIEFIQEFPYQSITIRHLLEQTSGIVSDDYVFSRAQQGVPLTNQIFLDFLINDKPDLQFEPGIEFQYNGFNHILLAILIERISGESYEEYIRQKIAIPLGMSDWFLRPARLMDFPKERAKGYKIRKDSIQAFDSDDFEAFYGDCNLFFSAIDLSKWSNSFISRPLLPEQKLSGALEVKSSLSDFNILHWYRITDTGKYHFTGDWKGFYAMVYFDREKHRSIVYLSNTDLAHWLRPAILRNINDFLDHGRTSDWGEPKPEDLDNEVIIGDYKLSNEETVSIYQKEGNLRINVANKSVDLFKLESNIYYAPGIDLWIWFTKDKNENIRIQCSSIYRLEDGLKISD